MKKLSSKEIRNMWLSFFEKKGHFVIQSAPILPQNDKSLLFINAGITPLKKYFDGTSIPPKKRLTNLQKCLRTNDIDIVGRTARHHTFFEMMGNFSIGDYFRNEALEYAFELLTSKDYFDISLDKLYVTYYPDDTQTLNKWLSLGIYSSHMVPNSDNFWEIGEGPSGPDTEIFFDRGEKYDPNKLGEKLIFEDIENDRYIEIWNIVFSQYNAKSGVERINYQELPHKNIDTGAGLERFCCIMQEGDTNFETDLFLPIIKNIEEISGVKYDQSMAFRVISDHIRTLNIAISDGAVFSNVGRGYVLKRILRRALKFARTLGIKDPFLYKLIPTVTNILKDTYPETLLNMDKCILLIKKEEEKFSVALEKGETYLLDEIKKGIKQIDGSLAFLLYDTYGFPVELTIDYANDYNLTVDIVEFNSLLTKARLLSRNSSKMEDAMSSQKSEFMDFKDKSEFVGYDTLETVSKVIKIFDSGIVLDKTPFYATSGGQEHDKGTIDNVIVKDVIKLPNGQHLHVVDIDTLVNDEVICKVDRKSREQTQKNHTSLHLLQKALITNLGNHIAQQGSFVNETGAHFDFNHYSLLDDELIVKIENDVNEKIKEKLKVDIKTMSIKEALDMGATALFSEKYHENVRVINIGNYSIELCGGTHVNNISLLEQFVILNCYSIAAGIQRIECSTTNCKEKMEKRLETIISSINAIYNKIIGIEQAFKLELPEIKGSYQDVINYNGYFGEISRYLKDISKKKFEDSANSYTKDLSQYKFNDSKKQIIVTNDIPTKLLKEVIEALFNHLHAETIFIVNILEDKLNYIVKSQGISAKYLISIASKVSGSGGGSDTFASGGTSGKEKLDEIIKLVQGALNE
ncbi:MAG: alanine--tRNA ligase [Acholeplasmatales bacterium]|jgi:alanyl-tRNA synthetase|nr:alanine--tRNA ligase [Acholeplasmatales bacterium]